MDSKGLTLIAVALVALILISRSGGDAPSQAELPPPPFLEEFVGPGKYTAGPVTRAPRVAPLPSASNAVPEYSSPALDMQATLAVRRRISREGNRVYLDSAWSQTDSVVVRWADRSGLPIKVAFTPDTTLDGWRESFVDAARSGMAAWSGNGAGLELEEVADPAEADITVGWVDVVSVEGEFGVTEISWDGSGRAQGAAITLALRPEPGIDLVPPGPMRRVAVHEFGHAMGLPHSSNRDDIMFQTSPVAAPSRRDQATLRLLYAVPPGSLRVP
jgi:predicted Zn-dependent protease